MMIDDLFVVDSDDDSITIVVDDILEGEKRIVATPQDVVDYFYKYHNNYTSTIRWFCDICGDHRPINDLAQYCLDYFKQVNRQGVEDACEKYGMRLR